MKQVRAGLFNCRPPRICCYAVSGQYCLAATVPPGRGPGQAGGAIALVERRIVDDMEALLYKLPPRIEESVRSRENVDELLEVVLDLGREAEARVPNESVSLGTDEVTYEDLRHVIDRVGNFGEDNRAGVERTLHRISAIRNRRGDVVGLTLRFGRAVYGTIRIIEDLIFSGKSVLLLGKPGVGKTTMLREVARVLADDAGKRVIVVDTSNEIAGDGDIPSSRHRAGQANAGAQAGAATTT